MIRYDLIRTLPDGTEKAHRRLRTMSEVELAASYVLMFNSQVPRGEARTFAANLTRQPFGIDVPHETSGYAFRVVTLTV